MTEPRNSIPSWNEQERLEAVDSYHILDTPREEDFDDIVKMAAQVCHVPVSLISFVTKGRQWFKAAVGTEMSETALDVSICKHAILQDEILIVPDTTKDSRTENNPLVTGDPHLRFYAGALLETPEGLPLGTVCVLDYKPRTLTEQEANSLKMLARQVMIQLELRRTLSELRRALEAKSRSEERLSLALDASGFIGMWEWVLDKDRVFADDRFVSAFGGESHWSKEGVPISEYIKAIHPADLDRITASIQKAVESGGAFFEEYRLKQKDGSVRWIEARGKCHYDQDGKPLRFPGVAIDITARKESQQQAFEAAEKYRFVTESMPHKISVANPKGEVEFVNREWIEYTGLTLEQIQDPNWTGWVHPDDLDERVRRWKESVAEGKPFEMEYRLRRKDGVYRWHYVKASPMRNAEGELIMWIGSNSDIDDQRRGREELEQAVALTQQLSMVSDPDEINRIATREIGKFLGAHRCYFFQAMPEETHVRIMPDWHPEGEIPLANDYLLEDFGPPEWWQAISQGTYSIDDIHTHPWTKDKAASYEAIKIGAYAVAPYKLKGKWGASISVSSDRPRKWTEAEKSYLENVIGRVWPLIERTKVEAELRASEERFRAMSDNIPPLAWMSKADGHLFWYNKRWYDYTGGTLETMQGDGWTKLHDPSHLPHVLETWQAALASGHPWEDTFPLRGADGNFRWFLSRAYPIRDADGKITLWFGVNTDVTDLREAQNALKEANAQLGDKAVHLEAMVQQRTQKLSETIGELEAFSYSISHDMRAPLRSMIGFSEALKEDYGPQLDEMAVDYLNRIANASRRMDQLIQDVLIFSRLSRQDVGLSDVDTDALIRDVIHSYPNLHADVVGISIKSPLPRVKGNEALLTQCFSNLLENGAKFVAAGTKPSIEVWAETSGGRTRLYFQDNGVGISETNQERIFEIFHRVGRDKEGTGIGLAIVRKAMEKMDGTVGVTSELGKGSVFSLDLQLA